jgi:hypothetical protein
MTEEQLQTQQSEPTGDESPDQAEVQADDTAASDGGDQTTGESPAAEPRLSGVQKRIDEITRARREAEREAEYWRMRAQQAPPVQQPTPQAQPAGEQPPTPQQFQTYDDYVTARAQYEGRQAAMALYVQAEQQRAWQAAQTEYVRRAQNLNERLIADGAKYPDFDDVVRSQQTRITTVMADALGYMPNPADIAYYLGKNRQESARIAQLPPIQQAIEIARIGATLAATPTQKTVSTAPAPPQALATRRDSGSPQRIEEMPDAELRKMSMEEFNRRRGRKRG